MQLRLEEPFLGEGSGEESVWESDVCRSVPNKDEEDDDDEEMESARVSRTGTERRSEENMADASSKPKARYK